MATDALVVNMTTASNVKPSAQIGDKSYFVIGNSGQSPVTPGTADESVFTLIQGTMRVTMGSNAVSQNTGFVDGRVVLSGNMYWSTGLSALTRILFECKYCNLAPNTDFMFKQTSPSTATPPVPVVTHIGPAVSESISINTDASSVLSPGAKSIIHFYGRIDVAGSLEVCCVHGTHAASFAA